MSKNVKRLLSLSMEEAMVEPVVGEAPDELVLEEVQDLEIPELDAVERLESTSDALDNFVENAPIADYMSTATLEMCALALESILIAGGVSEYLGGKITEASLESVGSFRVSIEEAQARVHGAISSFLSKVGNRFKEMFGSYKMTFSKVSKLVGNIEEHLNHAESGKAPSRPEIKVTDGHRLFINDRHTVADMKKGFENVVRVASTIDSTYIESIAAFAQRATEAIMKAYTGKDLFLEALIGVLNASQNRARVKGDHTAARNTDIASKEVQGFVREINDILAKVSGYKGQDIPMPGGRVIRVDSNAEGVDSCIPELIKADLDRRAVVTIATPSIAEIKGLVSVAKEAAAKLQAADTLLEKAWERMENEIENTIQAQKKVLDKNTLTLLTGANRARTHITRFIYDFFSEYGTIVDYSGKTVMHLLAFCEKAAKLYS